MSIREFAELPITHKNTKYIFQVARIKKSTTEGLNIYGDWIIQGELYPTDDAEVIEEAERQVNQMNQEFREKYDKHPTAEF